MEFFDRAVLADRHADAFRKFNGLKTLLMHLDIHARDRKYLKRQNRVQKLEFFLQITFLVVVATFTSKMLSEHINNSTV